MKSSLQTQNTWIKIFSQDPVAQRHIVLDVLSWTYCRDADAHLVSAARVKQTFQGVCDTRLRALRSIPILQSLPAFGKDSNRTFSYQGRETGVI